MWCVRAAPAVCPYLEMQSIKYFIIIKISKYLYLYSRYLPHPVTTLTTPGGKPTSSARLARWSAVRGVCSAGFGTEIRGKVLKEISGKTIF